ncbi:TPA: hypothetical protein ACJGT4_002092 [Salmonella enterica subsp. enterica]|nr:hypothetical protein [Salmonella enterica]ECC5260882.1 hypothetical protein [Salmonella enterica]MIL94247.1 hypothetical protein [Salmonella enterica]
MVENLEVQFCTSINEFLETGIPVLKIKRDRGITGTWSIEQVVYAYVSWIVVAALQRTIF